VKTVSLPPSLSLSLSVLYISFLLRC
jgi:hypothetical protein